MVDMLLSLLLHTLSSFRGEKKNLVEPMDLIRASLEDIVKALERGDITSEGLVRSYIEAIERDNVKGFELRAVLETAPLEHLIKVARKLDDERAAGKVRSILHGVPVLIKDSLDVTDELGFRTSAGTLILLESKAPRNAATVQLLVDAGAIILGTTNISSLSSAIGIPQPKGWSPRGGQAKSAHGEGLQHGLSSTGCAIALSAGFCALTIGEETDCSLNCPANCAGLYAIKGTPGLVPGGGAVPISSRQDCVGPMGKSPWDLAAALSVIAKPKEPVDYFEAVSLGAKKGLSDFRVGLYRGSKPWSYDLDPSQTDLIEECRGKYAEAIRILRPVVDPINCAAMDEIIETPWEIKWDEHGSPHGHPDPICLFAEFSRDFEAYIKDHEGPVKTLEQLTEWNGRHPELAYHPDSLDHPKRQEFLDAAAILRHSHNEYNAARKRLDEWRDAIVGYMDSEELDFMVIQTGVLGTMGPIAAAPTGMVCGTIPVGSLSNGAPISFYVIGRAHAETAVLQFMAAAEKALPKRAIPKRMLRD